MSNSTRLKVSRCLEPKYVVIHCPKRGGYSPERHICSSCVLTMEENRKTGTAAASYATSCRYARQRQKCRDNTVLLRIIRTGD